MNVLKMSSMKYVLGFATLALLVIPAQLFAAVTVYETQTTRDFLPKVFADQLANGGVTNETAAHGYPQYQVSQVSPTGQRICYLYDPSAYPTTWALGGFKSPGDNRMAAWDGVKWYARSANSFGNRRYNSLTCKTDAKADTTLTVNGTSEVTINRGESASLSWYSQYAAVRKATCTATNFDTSVTVPGRTVSSVLANCGSLDFFGFDILPIVGFSANNTLCTDTINETWVPETTVNQPFSGTKTVSPTQTTTYTYACTNANGTESKSVTVNVIQPDTEPIGLSCAPSVSSGVINEPITWTATVTGSDGPFTYAWEGTDGLSGALASVVKTYSTVGTKTARVTATYTPTGATPTTPSTPTTSSCLPGGSEIPAGYLCSAGGMTSVAWGQCCSGVASVRCPAPNEPAEAFCTGRPVPGGGTATPTVTSGPQPTWNWNYRCTGPSTGSVASVQEDGGTWNMARNRLARAGEDMLSPVIQDFVNNPQNYCLQGAVSQDCPPTGSGTCMYNFEWELFSGSGTAVGSGWGPDQVCTQAQGRFCLQNGGGARTWTNGSTPPPPTVTESGFSITTDCNGAICTNRSCTVEPGGGGPGGSGPGGGGPGGSGPGSPPTWGVTINLPGQCSVGPMCVGASIYNQALDCSRELVRACPFGCVAGACVAPQPEIDLSVTPAGVRRGESCTISVAARYVSSCSISGTGINQRLPVNANGMVPSQTFTTPGIENTTTYTVSCASPRGPATESVQCVFLPIFREQ